MKLSFGSGALLIFAVATLLPRGVCGRSLDARFLVGPVVGIVRPKGDFKFEAKAGFDAGISAEVLIGDYISLETDLAFARFGKASYTVPLGYGAPAASLHVDYIWKFLELRMRGRLFFTSSWPLNPFVGVNYCTYQTRRSDTRYGKWISHDRFGYGYGLGAGVACQVSRRVRGTLEAAYNEFDRIDDFDFELWGPPLPGFPTLGYWSLSLTLGFLIGPK